MVKGLLCGRGGRFNYSATNRDDEFEMARTVGVERDVAGEFAGRPRVVFGFKLVFRARRNRYRQSLDCRATGGPSRLERSADKPNRFGGVIAQLELKRQRFTGIDLTQVDYWRISAQGRSIQPAEG